MCCCCSGRYMQGLGGGQELMHCIRLGGESPSSLRIACIAVESKQQAPERLVCMAGHCAIISHACSSWTGHPRFLPAFHGASTYHTYSSVCDAAGTMYSAHHLWHCRTHHTPTTVHAHAACIDVSSGLSGWGSCCIVCHGSDRSETGLQGITALCTSLLFLVAMTG